MNLHGKHLNLVRRLIVYLNIFAIMFNACLYLFLTQYINVNELSYQLLESIDKIPISPLEVLIRSIILLIILVTIMYLRASDFKNINSHIDFVTMFEILLMIFIIYNLQGSYNGIILLVFMDIIYNARESKHWLFFLAISFLLLLFTDYALLPKLISIPSIDSYLSFLPISQKVTLSIIRNLLSSINMILFIVFIIVYLIESLNEQRHIKEELDMVSKVNTELKSYVALTEKIAEDRERKRIAREIHDTLGHALTGISAGIDACIVLIDVDKERTKSQLQIVSKVVREGIGDVRKSLKKLRPGALENTSLKDALNKMIKEYEDLSKLDIDFYYEWDNVDFDTLKEDVIFRLIQESITNSLRHGHASHVEINMFKTEKCYFIMIQDNGKGFEKLSYGYGLKQMNERIAMIGGKVSFYNIDGFRTLAKIPKIKGEDEND